MELSAGLLRCACRPCAMVLDLSATHGGRYRLVPERLQALPELAHDDAVWETLRIPVALAFLVRHSESGPVAVFPGALGPTDATIDPPEWSALEAAHPVIRELQSDVEAVLVNRARGARDCWLVPIDVCYRLVALLRGEWKGLSGGDTVWEKLDLFFDDLRRRAAPASSEPGEVAR
ncbi:MAG: hypothetical protein H0X69_00345 [Gemmatimonadales bacterium]|nr:hypothetical protein [Gemmatimonadales bacterium]